MASTGSDPALRAPLSSGCANGFVNHGSLGASAVPNQIGAASNKPPANARGILTVVDGAIASAMQRTNTTMIQASTA